MDPRIILVIQQILRNPESITDIYNSSSEYFFRYKGHVFSVLNRPSSSKVIAKWGPYSLYVYPKANADQSLSILAEVSSQGELSDAEMVPYHISECEEQEDREVFPALFELLRKKFSNVDSIIDDILKD